MASIVLEVTAQEAAALSALQRLAGAEKKVADGAKGIDRDSLAAARRMEALAAKIKDVNATPIDRFRKSMRDAKLALDRGLISQEDFNRESRRQHEILKDATSGHHKHSKAIDRTGESLRGFVLGYKSVEIGVRAATSALTEMEEAQERARRNARESEGDMSSLAQLAETPEEMAALTSAARRTFAEGGAESLDEAARLVFSLESAGALQDRELFTQLKVQRLVDEPAAMARAAATIMTSMGEEETGDNRAIVSKAFGASKFAPSSAEELLEAASRGGGSAAALGISDEELLAATAITSKATGTAELGGTQVASLLKSLDKAGEFVGIGLDAAITKIDEMGLQGEDLHKFFGRQEATSAFRTLLKNREELQVATESVRTAEADDSVGKKLQLAKTDPDIAAANLARRREALRDAGDRLNAQYANVLDAFRKEAEALDRASGKSEFAIALQKVAGKAVSAVLTDRAELRIEMQNVLGSSRLSEDLKKMVRDVVENEENIRLEMQALSRGVVNSPADPPSKPKSTTAKLSNPIPKTLLPQRSRDLPAIIPKTFTPAQQEARGRDREELAGLFPEPVKPAARGGAPVKDVDSSIDLIVTTVPKPSVDIPQPEERLSVEREKTTERETIERVHSQERVASIDKLVGVIERQTDVMERSFKQQTDALKPGQKVNRNQSIRAQQLAERNAQARM